MNSSVHNDYKNRDSLILGEGPTQLDDITFTAEAKYPFNYTIRENICIASTL